MKKRGFTLTEIILSVTILVSIGLIIAFGLNKLFDQSSQEAKLSFEDQIISSADLYLLNNSYLMNELQSERGFITISIADLINSGFLDSNLIDPETNEVILENKLVRISLDSDGLYKIEYEPEFITEPYLDARTLNLTYGISFDCTKKSSYQNEWRTLNLRPIDEDGFLMNLTIDKVIKDINCNVDTSKPGSYTIEYIYQIEPMNVTKSYKRNVTVGQNPGDIVNIYASAQFVSTNPNKPESCNPEASSNNPPVLNAFIINDEIIINVKGEKVTGEVVDLNINDYEIVGDYSTSSVGSKKSTITYKGENSNGAVPTTELSYSVAYDPDDIVSNLIVTSNKSNYIIDESITFIVKGIKRSGGTRILDPCEYIKPANANTNYVGTITPVFTYKGYNSDGKVPKGDITYIVAYDPEDITGMKITNVGSPCVGENLTYSVYISKRKAPNDWIKITSNYNVSGGSTSSPGTKTLKVTHTRINSDNEKATASATYYVDPCYTPTDPETDPPSTSTSTTTTTTTTTSTTTTTTTSTSKSSSGGSGGGNLFCIYYYNDFSNYMCEQPNCNPPPGYESYECQT